MRLRSHVFLPASGLALALLISGCGGSSSTSSSGGTNSGGGATAQVALFATDSFRDDYSHVWTTIYQVELLKAVVTTTTAYRDAQGNSLTAAAFFAALTATSKADVRGTYASGTLTAQTVQIGG